ncbi:MAG: N-acetyltransferase [Treponema sp.]|nr:N-acetyltransferase [Treponema sp.]
MAQNGNASQWGTTYPSKELIEADIGARKSYVCLHAGKIVATFYFAIEDEPTYAKINGAWLNNLAYGVVHRVASDGVTKGAGTFCIQWAMSQIDNIKIDTHQNNKPMQNLLEKLGFVRCGIINVDDGSERIAFQRYSPS